MTGADPTARVFHVDRTAVEVPSTEAERDQVEQQAIAQLLALATSTQQREYVKQILAEDDGSVFAVEGSPEAARLWSIIYAIRDARQEARVQKGMVEGVSRRPATVTFMLVEALPSPREMACLLRTTGPHAENIIALQQATASPELLAYATRMLALSRLDLGDAPPRRVYLSVFDDVVLEPVRVSEGEWVQAIFARPQQSPTRNVDGIGVGRAHAAQVPPVDLAMFPQFSGSEVEPAGFSGRLVQPRVRTTAWRSSPYGSDHAPPGHRQDIGRDPEGLIPGVQQEPRRRTGGILLEEHAQ